MAISTATLTTIATVLADAEAFLAGKPITIDVPAETFEVSGVKISLPAIPVTFSK